MPTPFAFFSAPPAAGGDPAFVGEIACSANYVAEASATTVITLSAGIAVGHRAVVVAASAGLTLLSAVDSKGNTWTLDAGTGDGFDRVGQLSSVLGTALAAADTITITWSGAGFIGKTWVVIDLSGCPNVDLAVQPALSFGSAVNVGGTTTAAKTVIVGTIYSSDVTKTYSGGLWTNVGTYRDNAQNSKRNLVLTTTLAAAGAQDPDGDWSAAVTQCNVWVAYKA